MLKRELQSSSSSSSSIVGQHQELLRSLQPHQLTQVLTLVYNSYSSQLRTEMDAIPPLVYHYTDKKGYDGIMQSSKVFSSGKFGRKNGTRFGDGVYMTSLGPHNKTKCILTKNFGSGSYHGSRIAKTEYVFEFRSEDLPGRLERINENFEHTKTILLYPWTCIDLKSVHFRVFRRSVQDSGVPNTVRLIRDGKRKLRAKRRKRRTSESSS